MAIKEKIQERSRRLLDGYEKERAEDIGVKSEIRKISDEIIEEL